MASINPNPRPNVSKYQKPYDQEVYFHVSWWKLLLFILISMGLGGGIMSVLLWLARI